MVKVKDIIAIMEKYFPLHLAEDWDNVGLQAGSREKEVKRIVIALDLDEQMVEEALKSEADLIITHHPLFFKAIKNIDYNKPGGRLLKSIIAADLAVYSAHTNLDAAEAGMNQVLAEKLGLKNIQPLFAGSEDKLVKLAVFVPFTHLKQVREAINKAGAGHIGNYSDCSFQTAGTGTFRPLDGSKPFLGSQGILAETDEYRLETIAYEHDIERIIQAMIDAHPYEEAAYDVYPLLNRGKIYSIGRKGLWPETADLKACARQIKARLNLDTIKIAGEMGKTIRQVAVIGGSGASLIPKIITQDIDLLITGDIKYHEAQEANKFGLAVIDAGHQETEQIIVPYIKSLLMAQINHADNEIEIFTLKNEPVFKYL
ncbi:MAG TPA: Nif3-like dinuclear metal center hexameric protein [Syntrophomonadaceae bacterium]|nr:Nif3-like dinuclear metal center hexameric protein [Syntrophomonadaceae bacterium]HPR92560.1 Nif3-like dinuclear metal center hexameric protein [Syntrophomonadaceae bacterium]